MCPAKRSSFSFLKEIQVKQSNFKFVFFRKPKTQRGKRFLSNRESKLEENTKQVMLIQGGKTSETVTQALRDIVSSDFK